MRSADVSQVVVVTGAARGLGREIALELAAQGRAMVLVDRLQPPLQALADELSRAGHQVAMCVADMTDSDSPSRVVATADEAFGGADALVNNAGIVDYAGL